MEPALYPVATPIGNLADLSARARDTLAGVAVIAAEDTRHSRKLLSHAGIAASIIAYHEHSAAAVAERIVRRIAGGEPVALLSDAGTPCISDPGYRLVRAVQDAGLRVAPIPGACAAVTALSAAGLPGDRFRFEGFLPARRDARRQRLQELANTPVTLVFYEAPHRILAALEDCVELLGPAREAAIARELTKRFETIRRAPLALLRDAARADVNQSRGEIVLMLGPSPRDAAAEPAPELLQLLRGMAEHMPARTAAKLVAAYSGIKTRPLYERLVQRRDQP